MWKGRKVCLLPLLLCSLSKSKWEEKMLRSRCCRTCCGLLLNFCPWCLISSSLSQEWKWESSVPPAHLITCIHTFGISVDFSLGFQWAFVRCVCVCVKYWHFFFVLLMDSAALSNGTGPLVSTESAAGCLKFPSPIDSEVLSPNEVVKTCFCFFLPPHFSLFFPSGSWTVLCHCLDYT